MGLHSAFSVDWFSGDSGSLLFSKSGDELQDCNSTAREHFADIKSLHDLVSRLLPFSVTEVLAYLERFGSWSSNCRRDSSRELRPELRSWAGTAASEDRLREQLQTLQRKLLHTVTENEALSTRLAGLRSVCLELQEQLQLEEASSQLDPGVQQHLLHLYSTAASYCEVESPGNALTGNSGSDRVQDIEVGFADMAGPEMCFGHTGSSSYFPTHKVISAEAVPDTSSGPVIAQGPTQGHRSGYSHKVCTDDAASALPSTSDPDYNALMHSFITLKASYDMLLNQQEPSGMSAGLDSGLLRTRCGVVREPRSSQSCQAEELPEHSKPLGTVNGIESFPIDIQTGLDMIGSCALSADWRADSMGDEISEQITDGGLKRLATHARALKASYDVMLMQRDQALSQATQQKAQFDRTLAEAHQEAIRASVSAGVAKAQFDKFVQDKVVEKAAFDLVLEQTVAEAVAQKAIADKALVDFDELQENATAVKAHFDKFVLDKAEEKAAFDLVLEQTAAEATVQKAIADKALVDFGELQESSTVAKAQFDKFVLDKTEEKAAFDLVLEQTAAQAATQKAIADKALVDFGELQESSTAAKAQFDMFVLDKTEEKAAFDLVLEQTAAQAATHKAIADKALVDFDELQESSTATKAQFDKFVLDKAEEKAAFDLVLEQTAAQAATHKAIADKALVDFGELQDSAVAAKAQFNKLVLDKAEEKAAFDVVLEQAEAQAAEQKAIVDKALVDISEVQVSAAAVKAEYDKFALDTAEEKVAIDMMLERTAAEAAHQKAIADKALVDFSELQATAEAGKAQHDKVLLDMADLQASADAVKSDFDKFVHGKAEEKAAFDMVLEQTVCEAAAQKAVADKALVDMCELQENATATKAQLDKYVTDKAEEKAAYDKLYDDVVASANIQKAVADKALADFCELQANADASKFEFDKYMLDKAEEKAAFDLILQQTVTEVAQHKATADKALEDMGQLQHNAETAKAQFEKLLMDTTEEKATYDAVLARTEAEAKAHKALADALKEEAETAAAKLAAERQSLDELQAQNERLLKQQEVLQAELQMALSNYKPKNDVGMALLQQLGNQDEARELTRAMELTLRDFGTRDSSAGRSGLPGSPSETCAGMMDCGNCADGPWGSLQGAIAFLIAPETGLLDPVPASTINGNGHSTSCGQLQAFCGQDHSRYVSAFSRSLHARTRLRSSAGTVNGVTTDPRSVSAAQLLMPGETDEFPEHPLLSEVEYVLASCNNWQFDVFKLADVTQHHALSTLGYFLFYQADLIGKFDIKPQMLARFMRRVEEGYQSNPYHSKTHAADVLQSLHVTIHRGGLAPGYVDSLTLMACYLSAMVHDYEHGGLTNDYLINSSDLLALRYNDRAPLENHHLAAAFTLMKKPEYAFLGHLPKADNDSLRKMVIELVLATDMKQHFAIMSHFTTVHRLGSANSVTPSLLSGTERRRSSSNASSVNSLLNGGSGCPIEMDKIVIPLDENERILSLQMALKCADLGHVCASLPVHCRWVALLEEEFFRQGDMEKAHNLPVSPLFDRNKPGITKSQVGFFDIVVIPLLNCYSRVFPNTKPLLTYTMRNYKFWTEQQRLEHQAAAGAK